MEQEIRFVVWGVGANGERAVDLLGLDKIIAFIDSDSRYKGQFFHNLRIMSFDECVKLYNNYIIIITPVSCDSIISFLKQKSFINYVCLYDIVY